MKIGMYHDSVGTKHAGGIAIYARQMAIELARSNEVYVYTQGDDIVPPLVESEAHIIETPTFDSSTLDSRLTSLVGNPFPVGRQELSKLAMTIWSSYNGVIDHMEEHVDVLLTFQTLDDLLLSNLVDIPTVRGFLSDRSAGIGSAIRERYTQTDLHFANTPYLADQVASKFGYEVDAVIPTGVDTELFDPKVEPAFDRDEITILFVGRVVESKGIFDLLKAVACLDEEVHLRIVGAGNEESVRHHARKLNIADQVMLDGEVAHTDLPSYYTAADIFCLPTHVDSFATVNLEAMACGTAVVTTDLDGIETYLSAGENGVVVTPGDQDELAETIRELIRDPTYRESLALRARERAYDFQWRQQAKRLEAFCTDVLPEKEVERDHVEKQTAVPS
ncbi:glycosyltransferase family 1 protein [Haloterrigena sp. H1]|nr:glycosyltransferase family 1 protein [Haloterrigena sp. H1]